MHKLYSICLTLLAKLYFCRHNIKFSTLNMMGNQRNTFFNHRMKTESSFCTNTTTPHTYIKLVGRLPSPAAIHRMTIIPSSYLLLLLRHLTPPTTRLIPSLTQKALHAAIGRAGQRWPPRLRRRSVPHGAAPRGRPRACAPLHRCCVYNTNIAAARERVERRMKREGERAKNSWRCCRVYRE